jgi:hypothetical protein
MSPTLNFAAGLSYIQIRNYEADVGIHLGRAQEPGKPEKHRISFGTAVHVFDDPFHVTAQDREVEGEARWQTIGMVNGLHMLLVAHTVGEHEEEAVIRVLSARKATRRERNIYAQGD